VGRKTYDGGGQKKKRRGEKKVHFPLPKKGFNRKRPAGQLWIGRRKGPLGSAARKGSDPKGFEESLKKEKSA